MQAHRKGRDAGAGRDLALVGQRGDPRAGAVLARPLPAVVGALDRLTLDLAHRERGAAMGAAIRHHRRLTALGEEDGKRFAEQHRSLGAALEILEPGDRLPTVAQREGNVLAGRDSEWALAIHRVLVTISDFYFTHSCLPK